MQVEVVVEGVNGGRGEKEEKGVEEEECGKGVSKRTDGVTGRLNKKRVGMERVGGKRKG